MVTLDDSEIPAPPPSPGLGMIINDRLARLFYELEADAYNADYHNYYYKEANQIIRKHFERLPDLISAVVEERMRISWIDKDRVAGICLNKILKNEPDSSPLFDVSGKLLRQLIVTGIDIGLGREYFKLEGKQ